MLRPKRLGGVSAASSILKYLKWRIAWGAAPPGRFGRSVGRPIPLVTLTSTLSAGFWAGPAPDGLIITLKLGEKESHYQGCPDC